MRDSNFFGGFRDLSRPSTFAARILDFNPNPRQAEVLDSQQLRGILCCSRQWGKSTTVAAKAVHHAILAPDSLIVVIAPTLRQSAELLKTMRRFVRRCGHAPTTDPANKFSMVLPNRARILALPADEDNIRGH